MDDDQRRWDRRHQRAIDDNARRGAGLEPAPPDVLTHAPDLDSALPSTGHAVDLACGPGSVTLWLAARGLDVVAIDVSPVAIAALRESARAHGLEDRISARVIDLDGGIPDELVDLDLVVCQRFRDPALYPTIVERLRPGGCALVTVLSEVGADEPGQFHAPASELLDAFADTACDTLHHCEAAGLASIVVRRR